MDNEWRTSRNSMFGDTMFSRQDIKRNRRIMLIVILTVIQIPYLLWYIPDFLFTLKPGYDVEYVLENGAREGMHVSGMVPYTYHCFAEWESTSYNKVTGYYYAIPAGESMLVLYIPAEKDKEMQVLLAETMDFLETGIWPESTVMIEGSVVKAQGRIPYLLGQYMAEIGYTQAEIDAMGEPLMIQDNRNTLQKARLYGPVCIIILMLEILGIIFYVFRNREKFRRFS